MKKPSLAFRLAVISGLALGFQTSAIAQVIVYAPAGLPSIPTLTEWAMVTLAVLIGLTGLYLRRSGHNVLSSLLCVMALFQGIGTVSEIIGNAGALQAQSMYMNGGGTVNLSGYASNQDIHVIGNSSIDMRIVSVVPASSPTSGTPTCAVAAIITAGSYCYYRPPASEEIGPGLIAQSFFLADRCSEADTVNGNWKELSRAHASNPNLPLSATIKNAASKGVATISGDTVSYLPDLDSDNFYGDSFSITISEGSASTDVVVSLGTYFSVSTACSSDTTGLDGLVRNLPPNLEVLLNIGHAAIGEMCQQRLSEARSIAVKNYLVAKGVGANRIYSEGRGSSDPAVIGPVNSRVEVTAIGKGTQGNQLTESTSVGFPPNTYKICQ